MKQRSFALASALACGIAASPLAANPLEQFDQATSHSQNGRWKKAAALYVELIEVNPYRGAVCLGMTRQTMIRAGSPSRVSKGMPAGDTPRTATTSSMPSTAA